MEEPWPLGCCLAQAYGFCSLDKQTALYLTVGYYSALKRKEILTPGTWMDCGLDSFFVTMTNV
jgi:hypothetical protein